MLGLRARPRPLPACSRCGSEAAVRAFGADKVKCIPGALNLFHPAHKACEAGRVFPPRDTAPTMLKHVGESLQRPRSQLLHQILHFWIQHPVLGKKLLFSILRICASLGAVGSLSSRGRPRSPSDHSSSYSESKRRFRALLRLCPSSHVRIEAAAARPTTAS